jgi:hypothetical protein
MLSRTPTDWISMNVIIANILAVLACYAFSVFVTFLLLAFYGMLLDYGPDTLKSKYSRRFRTIMILGGPITWIVWMFVGVKALIFTAIPELYRYTLGV